MTAITIQRIELIYAIVDKWHSRYNSEPDADKRHMMITALLSAYAHELPVKRLREWSDLLGGEVNKMSKDETPEEKAERERREKESPKKVQDWMKQIKKTVPKVGDGKPIKKGEDKKKKK